MRNVLIYVLFVFLFPACQNTPLERALKMAGQNRKNLEQVLEYYRRNPADSLKLRAAVFLIENMPGHYSYRDIRWQEDYYNEIERAVDPLQTTQYNKEVIEKISAGYWEYSNDTCPDLHLLKAAHLVDHIERSFEAWQQGEWATHVSFDDFCEYILPYKGDELQIIDNWREEAQDLCRGDLDSLHYCDMYKNSAYWAVAAVNNEIIKANRLPYPYEKINCIPIQRIRTLARLPFGSCDDYALLSTGLMRSKGIPVAIDFTPQWPFRSQGHAWTVVLTNRGKNIEFPAGFANPGEPHKPDEKKAKVFRKCYAINKELEILNEREKHVPYPFTNVFIKDVTDEYISTSDVELSIPSKFRKYRYAYLAVFDNKSWSAIHYGKVSNGKVVFTKMGRNCLYMPIFCDREGVVPFSSPFIINYQGEIRRIEADRNKKQAVTLYRKYYVSTHCYDVAHRLLGGKFQAANKEDFSDAVTLHQVTKFTVQSQEIALDTMRNAYRYWRYCSGEGQFCHIAEIYFYKSDTASAVYGQITGTEDPAIADTDRYRREAVFDRDPLTYFNAPVPSDGWVGMDFGEPVRIDHIWYTPRGDGNDITPGDEHELLYWSGNKWVSLGRRIAEEPVLVYDNVPVNALLLIRNLSRGHEERIFTYEKGEQVWW
ncbi:MAG: hypothetical protein LBK58_11060 [Prevotellaceae bacterium]|jgi:hypothetical protein|nr:hypothetical protein [Prevotellaceae bacterium]